jgi:hypothetical protein
MLVGYAVVMWGMWKLAARARKRRGVGSAVMSAVDEVFHPAERQTFLEVQVQVERKEETPSPGDPTDEDQPAAGPSPRDTPS